MSRTLLGLVRELNTLNDDNLADCVIANNDVQWCLFELQNILEAEQPTHPPQNKPLKPEELKKWNRSPAWIMPLGKQPWNAQWSIMEYGRFVVETSAGATKSVCLSMGEYGKTWKAYRCPLVIEQNNEENSSYESN